MISQTLHVQTKTPNLISTAKPILFFQSSPSHHFSATAAYPVAKQNILQVLFDSSACPPLPH